MSFVWAFKRFIREKSPYALSHALNISDKAVYSWATDEDSPFHRKTPLDKAVEVLDVFKRHTPELLYEVLCTATGWKSYPQKKKAFLQWKLEQSKPISIKRSVL